MGSSVLADRETVMLVDTRGRRYLKQLRAGHRLTVRGTVLACDDLIGADEGTLTPGTEPERFRVLRPGYMDLSTQIARPAEPIFAKDAGSIIIHAGIRAGEQVIEVGVGGGVFTLALLGAVGPHGRISSYEIRADLAEAAATTVATYHGEAPGWRIRIRDGCDGFEETGVDHVTMDLPEPVPILDAAAAALRPGGSLTVYLPTVLQIKTLRDALEVHPAFGLARTIEVMERSWHIEDRSVRPDHRMVAHTAFLSFARRLAD